MLYSLNVFFFFFVSVKSERGRKVFLLFCVIPNSVWSISDMQQMNSFMNQELVVKDHLKAQNLINNFENSILGFSIMLKMSQYFWCNSQNHYVDERKGIVFWRGFHNQWLLRFEINSWYPICIVYALAVFCRRLNMCIEYKHCLHLNNSSTYHFRNKAVRLKSTDVEITFIKLQECSPTRQSHLVFTLNE